MLHGVAAGRLGIVIDEHLVVQVLAAGSRQYCVVKPGKLLSVGAERNRDVAGRLDLRRIRQKLLPRLRRLHLQLIEHLDAVELIVRAMDVHRDGDDMPVIGHVLDQQRRQVRQPVALLRLVIQWRKHALLGQLSYGDADIPLHCCRRIAAGDAVERRGMFRLRSDGGIIHPGAASLVILFREHGDRSGFAAAGPPMHDIRVLRDRLARRTASLPARSQRPWSSTLAPPMCKLICYRLHHNADVHLPLSSELTALPGACRPRSSRRPSWSGNWCSHTATTGNIEASTTRSPCTPRTLPAWSVTAIGSSSAPMRQEHEQCHTPPPRA